MSEMQNLPWKITWMAEIETQFVEGCQIIGRETFCDK